MLPMLLLVLISILLLSSSDEYQKTIWTYWEGPVTSFIHYCINKTRNALSPEWTIHFLTPQNITYYCSDEEIPAELDYLAPQQKADYIRLLLIYRYGGLWMDTSTIITSLNYLNDLYATAKNNSLQFIGYCNGDCEHKRVIENGVFYAPARSIILRCWIHEMDKMFEMGIRNYIYHELRNGLIEERMFLIYPQVKTYFGVYIANEHAIQRSIPQGAKYETMAVYSHYYRMHITCKMNQKCLLDNTYNWTNLQTYPITKYWSKDRALVDPYYTATRKGSIDIKDLMLGVVVDDCHHLLWTVYIASSFAFMLTILLWSLKQFNLKDHKA